MEKFLAARAVSTISMEGSAINGALADGIKEEGIIGVEFEVGDGGGETGAFVPAAMTGPEVEFVGGKAVGAASVGIGVEGGGGRGPGTAGAGVVVIITGAGSASPLP